MPSPNVKEDARRVYEAIKGGGLAILQLTVGYTMMGSTAEALDRMFLAKKRGPEKRHAMGGNLELHQQIHIMHLEHAEMVRCLIEDFDLPLGIVAPYRKDHPIIKNIDTRTLEVTTAGDTLFMLINAGKLLDEVTKLTMAVNIPILGSSSNLSGTGAKFRFEDVPEELKSVSDVTLDYGLIKFVHSPRTSSTMLDFSGPVPKVLRIGVGYEIIRDHIQRFWGTELPNDPGFHVNPSGHMGTAPAPLKSLQDLITVS
ncbi:hypothetical protein NA57DRAFT_51270 [Rhizodiscina lignyota]|uniref:Threonylcarbamoyl-AMP synthase n=1 Tax=Rhizodiscina lignyota TaxID=1504668 RepID=A0A9P4IU10_9PEZI|nr:hypothetical protein NA57DRAFT_51270 [Rhizodiscina lignyota]